MPALDGGRVAAIRPGLLDRSGLPVVTIYQRKDGEYVVYQSDNRVLVQFADDLAKADQQRRALAPLLPLRDDIDGLTREWRHATPHGLFGERDVRRLEAKALFQDRRVSGALVQAFEDDVPGAQLLLEKIRSDIVGERVAAARFEYLLTAFATALFTLFTAWLLSSLLPASGANDVKLQGRGMLAVVLLLVVAAIGGGLAAAGRWTPRIGNGLLFAVVAVPLVAVLGWATLLWFAPNLSTADLGVSRSAAVGLIALGMAGAVGLALATAHRPTTVLRTALVFAVIAIPLFAILIWPQTPGVPVAGGYGVGIDMWRGCAAGAVGAFFSISLAIRGRTVLPDLLRTANLMDAVLRVTIGAIGGAVLIALIKGGVVQFKLSTDVLLSPLIAGFFAGFSERLVPDMLEKAGEKTAEFNAKMAGSRAQRDFREPPPPLLPVLPSSRPPAATQPPGAPAVNDNPVDDDDVEVGAGGFDLNDDEATHDDELPAAVGGLGA